MNIEAERLNRGLSSRIAADQIGVDRRTLERAERGEGVNPAKAKLIADFYGVLVTDILPLKHSRDLGETACVEDDERTAA